MAQIFFDELHEFSCEVFAALGIAETESVWKSGAYAQGEPRGCVLHWTGSTEITRPVRWFMEKARGAKAAAHIVVAESWPAQFRTLAEKWPRVAALPTMAVICVPVSRVAWHATWANTKTWGIEIVNSGQIKKDPRLGWCYWPKNWMQPWAPEGGKVDPLGMGGRYWDQYSADQIATVLAVLKNMRAIVQAQGRDFDPGWILGHEHIQAGKPDPGPALPLYDIRRLVFSDALDLAFWSTYRDHPRLVELYRDEVMERATGAGPMFARAEFAKVISAAPGKYVKAMMAVLGYDTTPTTSEILAPRDEVSRGIFSKMVMESSKMKTTLDLALVPRELAARVKNRGYCRS